MSCRVVSVVSCRVEKSMLMFYTPKCLVFFSFFDVSMIISIDLDAKAYLRYWSFALTSISSSNLGCDRLPSEFSKNDSPSRETALDEKKWGIAAVALKNLKIAQKRFFGNLYMSLFLSQNKSGNNPEHALIIPKSSPEYPKIDQTSAKNRPMLIVVAI